MVESKFNWPWEPNSLRTLYTHSCVIFSILFVRFFIQLEKNRDKNQERCLGCWFFFFLGEKRSDSFDFSKFNWCLEPKSKHTKTEQKVEIHKIKCQKL